MTDTISEILENTLFDLSDTLKIHLIELNENRSLFMNGPSRELIQRTFNISFYRHTVAYYQFCMRRKRNSVSISGPLLSL